MNFAQSLKCRVTVCKVSSAEYYDLFGLPDDDLLEECLALLLKHDDDDDDFEECLALLLKP